MIIIFDEVINHHGDIYQVLYEFIVVLFIKGIKSCWCCHLSVAV